jgi:glycosyltransferase involved in cell wall biosynthesis
VLIIVKSTSGTLNRVARLRIALLPEYFYPYMGGGEEWFKHIGSGLAGLGHSVEVFAFPMSDARNTETMGGVRVTRAGIFVIDKWQPYFKRAISHVLTFFFHPIRNSKCDVAIGQGSALLGAFPLLWARHIPTVCVVHDIYGLHESIRDKGLVKGVARYFAVERLLHKLPFNAWITVSEATKKKIEQQGVPPARITIIRNGIDEKLLRCKSRRRQNTIAYLGRLVKHKHPEDLIYALSRLDPKVKWTARIAGEGELLPDLQQLTRRLGLEKRVQFLGRIDNNEKIQLLASCTCLVLPSMAEGWGVVLAEAAAVGTPSIAYDTPGVREQAEVVPSIRLVQPRRADELAARISYLLNHPKEVTRLGKIGRGVVEKFSWESSVSLLNSKLGSITKEGYN